MERKISVSLPYSPFYDATVRNIIANTPRASGKSYEMAQKVALAKIGFPKHDIVVFRANANSLEASVVNEIMEKFVMLGYGGRVKQYSKPLRIEFDGGKSVIWFMGVSGHDKSRVRGFKPKNPLCLIVGDECQQISEESNLKHALATFRRYLDTTIDYKVILCGNPHEVKGHWWNVYVAQRKGAKGYVFVNATYLDIYNLLNADILEEIELEKNINPAIYRFMYLGDLTDINGGAYPSFRRERHLITLEQANEIFANETIEKVIIGGDGAITHDMTCCNCIAHMTSGRVCVLEPFIFNPLTYGRALAPSELAEDISEYLADLEEKYQFQRNGVPVYLAVDCASADLIAQLRYILNDYYRVLAFTQKNVIRNTSTTNNTFAKDMCYIVNYGGYKDYTTGRFIYSDVPLLVEQLESVVWKNSKLDPAVPNDCSDSLVYGLCTLFENPQNLNVA